MSSTWVRDAESTVFTVIKKKVESKFKSKYKNLYFTRELDNEDLEKNLFPTVYVFFSEVEIGNDLDNTSINAVLCTMQIQVIASKSQGLEVAKDIIYYALDIAKSMRFKVAMMPEVTAETSSAKTMTVRLNRAIGYNDILY